jgi:hypothetical protein
MVSRALGANFEIGIPTSRFHLPGWGAMWTNETLISNMFFQEFSFQRAGTCCRVSVFHRLYGSVCFSWACYDQFFVSHLILGNSRTRRRFFNASSYTSFFARNGRGRDLSAMRLRYGRIVWIQCVRLYVSRDMQRTFGKEFWKIMSFSGDMNSEWTWIVDSSELPNVDNII